MSKASEIAYEYWYTHNIKSGERSRFDWIDVWNAAWKARRNLDAKIFDELFEVNRLNVETIKEIREMLFGKNFEVLGWHLNGSTEAMDTWFYENDWAPIETDICKNAIRKVDE